jgi:hypothetical protein
VRTIAVCVADVRGDIIGNSSSAAFVFELWRWQEKYRELPSRAGKQIDDFPLMIDD